MLCIAVNHTLRRIFNIHIENRTYSIQELLCFYFGLDGLSCEHSIHIYALHIYSMVYF